MTKTHTTPHKWQISWNIFFLQFIICNYNYYITTTRNVMISVHTNMVEKWALSVEKWCCNNVSNFPPFLPSMHLYKARRIHLRTQIEPILFHLPIAFVVWITCFPTPGYPHIITIISIKNIVFRTPIEMTEVQRRAKDIRAEFPIEFFIDVKSVISKIVVFRLATDWYWRTAASCRHVIHDMNLEEINGFEHVLKRVFTSFLCSE